MTQPDTSTPADAGPAPVAPQQEQSGNPLDRLARHIGQIKDKGARAALARVDPAAPLPHQLAVLTRAFVAAGLTPEGWQPATWRRWALIAHGIAMTGHAGGRLGGQLAQAGVAESRVTRLLLARGDALMQLLPRLLRLLASKEVRPDWHALGELILKDGQDGPGNGDALEHLRLRIAADYYAALARADA